MKPKSHRILSAFATLLLAAIFAMFPAHGINIIVIPETPLDGAPEHPDDPGSAKLFFLAEKAAAYWEARFPNGLDPHNLTMRFSYTGDAPQSGYSNILTQVEGRPTVAEVRMSNTKLWFYDDDPYDHSEFDMVQTLVRDLTNSEYAAAFASGGVPGMLEVSYEGEARLDAPADARNNQDMYSLLLHEIGHNLGMSSDLNACDTELVWNTASNWVGASLPSSFNDVAIRHTDGVLKVVNLTGSGFCKDLLHVGITPTDLILGAAWSTDLETWSAEDIESGSDGFNEIHCLDKRLFRSKIPFGTLPAEFLRIQITEVGP